jgi:hypothetical protein
MGFRNEKVKKFEKIELEEPLESMGNVFDGVCTTLEEMGIDTKNTDPEITVVLNNGIEGPDGKRLTRCVFYIGATPEEVVNDLFLTQQKK